MIFSLNYVCHFWERGKGHQSLGSYPHQFINVHDCSHFHLSWKLFLTRFPKHYSIHSKRKRRLNTLLKHSCPHRFFFPLESGWKRPGDTCDILLCNLMRYWQPLGCCGDKGGKRAYTEEISQGFGRKEAKWQSNWLKKTEGAQRGLYKKHLPALSIYLSPFNYFPRVRQHW